MKIIDLIQETRTRLKDLRGFNNSAHKYDSTLIMSVFNREQNALIRELELNARQIKGDVTPENNTIILHAPIFKIFSAKLNDINIPLRPFTFHLKHSHDMEPHLVIFSNLNAAAILPERRASGQVKIWGNFSFYQNNESENIFLPPPFRECLMAGIIKSILQNENSEASLVKMQFYENLYAKELSWAKALMLDTKTQGVFYSKVHKI